MELIMTTRILLLALGVLLIGAVLWILRTRATTGNKAQSNPTSRLPGLANPEMLVPPMPFGYKTGWFAVHTSDATAVAEALQLKEPRPANWQYGIWHSVELDDYAIFVSPPVNGWVLAMGLPILFEADNHATERMIELSHRFGEAQFFSSMRVSDAYVWAQAKNGRLVRRFYEADGARSETGPATKEEQELGTNFFDGNSPEANDPNYWKRKDLISVDERYVLQIAGKWSVNPARLDQMGLLPALGILGRPSESYPPKPRRH